MVGQRGTVLKCCLLFNPSHQDSYAYNQQFLSYVIIQDLAAQGWLVQDNAAEDLWPKLLYLYSRSGETRDLAMVYGEFYE